MVNKALTAFGVIIAALVGLYLVLWALFDSAKTAAAVMVTIVLMSLGYVAGHIQWRNRDTTQQPPIYTAEATPVRQLPEPQPKFFQTTPNSWTRSDRIDAEAQRIAQILRDRGAPPTRDSIATYGNVYGHEAARAIVDKWEVWGWITPPSQGVAGEWVDSA